MKRLNKTMRKRKQRRQRSRRHSYRRKTLRRQRGGLPVPPGSLVGISSKGEYGVPMLVSKEFAEKEQEREGLED